MKRTPEREVKLDAPGDFVFPDLSRVVDGVEISPLPAREYESVYYDTPDLRLARWGVSLRHRSDEGWTLKLPTEDREAMLVRQEVTFQAPPAAVPPEAASLVRAYVRSAPLKPVARMKTHRRRLQARDASGARFAEIVDDDVLVYRGRRRSGRFREIEVELSDAASEEVLDGVVRALRRAGAGAPAAVPKIVRVLGPQARAPRDVVVPGLGPKSTIGEVIRAAIADAATRIIVHDAGVRLGDDPEDVHQARVATRRLRSDLRTLAPTLEEAWAAALRAEAGWLGGLLGPVRDADVLRERFQRQADQLPKDDAVHLEPLFALLAGERDAARSVLLSQMNERRYVAFLDRLVEASIHPALAGTGGHPAAELLPGLVRKPWRRLRREVRDLPAEPADEALHQVRIRAERCRYAAETAAPVLGKPAEAFARAVAALQTVLGEQHDAVVAGAWLRLSVEGPSPDEAMVVGDLVAAQRAEAAVARASWPEAWRRASKRKLRGWLR